MRTLALAAVAVVACASKNAPPPPAPLTDVSTSLEAARTTFNAHVGEPRFLTLLSPT